MTHHTAHDKVGNGERREEGINVFIKCLDDRDERSLCQISGVSISCRQFFPCEGIRQAKKQFDVGFTIPVMRKKLQLENESITNTDILSYEFKYLYYDLLNLHHCNCDHPKTQANLAK